MSKSAENRNHVERYRTAKALRELKESGNIEERILADLDPVSGTSVTLLTHLGVSRASVSAALQRLKSKGLAECAHGYMGWSWFAVEKKGEAAR